MKRWFYNGGRIVKIFRRSVSDDRVVRSSAGENQIYFSQDKDLVPEVEIKSLEQIRKEYEKRYFKRHGLPSSKWMQRNECTRGLGSFPSEKVIREFQKELFDTELRDKKTGAFMFRPQQLLESTLQIGDVCLLEQNSHELTVCVELPTSFEDPRYTFVQIDGSIVYSIKSKVQLRLPRFYSQNLGYLLHREEQHEFARVGTVKNDISQTYLVPMLARKLITSFVSNEISQRALKLLPDTVAKVELLHRRLQLNSGPRQFSVFKLVQLVSELQLSSKREMIPQLLDEAFSRAGIDFGGSGVLSGLTMGLRLPKKLDASLYLATYWALQQQQKLQMWGKISRHGGIFSPISVTVLPFYSQVLYYQNLTKILKMNNYEKLDEFTKLVNREQYVHARTSHSNIVQLLKDYCAGNFHNNEPITYLVTRLFKRLDKYKNMDVTRDLCFEVLKKICPNILKNPLHWCHELEFPDSTERTVIDQRIYDLSSPPNSPDNFNRTRFDDEICYCIDSLDAHEIDDGVSIRKLSENRYKILVHVADPSSSFDISKNPEASIDPIFSIAFHRAFTTYLPDRILPMMPKSYSKSSDLGTWGVDTKTVTFSFDIDLSKKDFRVYPDSFNVNLGVTSKSKRITYEHVDQLLESSNPKACGEVDDLRLLFQVANKLKHNRVCKDDAIIFGDVKHGLVSLRSTQDEGLSNITFTDQKVTKSNTLVSELMIVTNVLASSFFAQKKIPGIYRGYRELDLKFDAGISYNRLRAKAKKGLSLSSKDVTKLSSLLTNSFYTSIPTSHSMLGAISYLTVTSPLRRFPDMLNHLQLQRYLRSIPMLFSQEDLHGINWHLLSRDVVIKDASNRSNTFWTLQYIKLLLDLHPTKNKWTVIIQSLPSNGFIRCRIENLYFSTGRLKITTDIYDNIPKVGTLITSCIITKLDCLEGALEFSTTPASTFA